MQQKIENKIHEIADAVFEGIDSGAVGREGIGLFSGQIGVIIFCRHYLRAYPCAAKEETLDRFLESYFGLLTSELGSFTYCTGLTGNLEGLRYLNDTNMLEVDYSDIEDSYRNFLQQYALANLSHENYDYLHGALGIVKYFSDDPEFVNKALETLEQMAEKHGAIYKWKSKLGVTEKTGYNIALSHGISSIVSVSSLLTHPKIDHDRRDRIVRGACNYILTQEIDPIKYGSMFPSQSLENDPAAGIARSRMGWCYGDLGVATSLWQAGKLLKDQDLMNKALGIMNFSSHRRDFADCGIFDAGLCHGAASVCMMFHYMYQETGNAQFAEARDYWFESTLKMGTLEQGLAGYGTWRGDTKEWKTEYSLLEGVAGIGLMLMALRPGAAADDGKWMEFFMLNQDKL